MTACRVKRRLALVVAGSLALPMAAVAQLDPEIAPLVAPGQGEQPPSSITIDTAPAVEPAVPQAPPPLSTNQGGISIGPLGELNSGSAGTLEPGDGGLDPTLWRDTDASRLIDLFSRLPVSVRSPAMHDLARRMMLSTAGPPTLDTAVEDFIAARLDVLIRLGEFDDATELVGVLPSAALGDRARWHAVDALFWADDVIGACALTRDQIRVTPTPAWRKALMFCQASSGETDAAGLSLALLRDRADPTDQAFLAAAGKLLGQLPSAPPALDDGLSFAATIAAGIAVPENLVGGLGPTGVRALADQAQIAAETRLAAAERAASFGALSPEGLAAAYMEPVFSETELGDPRGQADDTAGPFGRALLFQAIRAEQASDQRAGLLSVLFSAPGGPGFGPLARASGVSLLSVSPADTVIWFASDAMPALIAGARFEAAQAWYLALAELAVYQPEAKLAQINSLPLLAAARIGAGRNWQSAMAAEWWAALPESYDPAARAAAATPVFMALDALGLPIGPDGWALYSEAPTVADVEIPNIGIRYAMRDAARAKRIGEAALWALIALGEAGPVGADAITLGSVVRSLRAVGLEQEARALALEALIEAAR